MRSIHMRHMTSIHRTHISGHATWLIGDVKTDARNIREMWDCQFGWGTGITLWTSAAVAKSVTWCDGGGIVI